MKQIRCYCLRRVHNNNNFTATGSIHSPLKVNKVLTFSNLVLICHPESPRDSNVGTGFYSLNPCCLWLHTTPPGHLDVWKLVYKLMSHHVRHSWECVNLHFVLPYHFCIFSIVMYLNVSIDQFGTFWQTWYKILSCIATLHLITLQTHLFHLVAKI